MSDDPRIDQELWTQVRDQGKAIIALESNQESVRNSLMDITTTLKALSTDVKHSGKTQWPVIFGTVGSAMSFVVILGGVLSYAWVSDIGQISDREAELRNDLQAHARAHGHPEAVLEKMVGLEKSLFQRLDQMDKRIDRVEERAKILYKEGKAY